MASKARPTVIRYEREGDMVRLTLANVTNHELREVLIGLWCRLDEDDRGDHIDGLTHYYHDHDSWLGPIAVALKEGTEGEQSVNLRRLMERGEKIRP